ncbi:MAG: helix-turn-helix domain-containing protein [Conexibacteraceae bacterium]|nr:helix-turn-helix domain-containing protein [Conexibacteraceae bacterium]
MALLLGQGVSVEQIAKRFGKDPSTVSYWMKKHGLVAPNREKYAAKGGIERERLEELVDRGLTLAAIASEVGRSVATVRHWLSRYGLRTQNGRGTRRPETIRSARDAGKLTITMHCKRHGEAEFILEGRGYYRCKSCRAERVVQRRRKVKRTLVAEAGGCCCLCGYDRYLGALQFHHLDPSQKRLGLSYKGSALALNTLRAEATKCVLLCANCHAEVEGEVVAVSLK